jgi:osmotically inducible lipoprotein OsmB
VSLNLLVVQILIQKGFRMNKWNGVSFAVLVLMLAACGQTAGDRAISGAGIGAGVGALGGAVAGGSALTGAAIGGAVGAATGALTDENDVNLGKPAWKR